MADVNFGYSKRLKLNEEGKPNDMVGKFLGILPTWMAPPDNLNAPPSEYQMMGLAVFEPVKDTTLGSAAFREQQAKDLASGVVRYELLMTSSIATGLSNHQRGDIVVVEFTNVRQKTRRGFFTELYVVKGDVSRILEQPLFDFLPTSQTWSQLSAELQTVALKRKSLAMGALADDADRPALPASIEDTKREIWGDRMVDPTRGEPTASRVDEPAPRKRGK